MKAFLQQFLPKPIFSLYHFLLARLAALYYKHPSRQMVIIGVTGTRGKTTTANYIWSVLTAAGYKTGLTGTANIRIGSEERINPYHMTMPGRFQMQKLLAEMKNKGCEIVIVETPSEGVEQHRQVAIAYDVMILTSLYPEYLAIHNRSYERLKIKIEKLFRHLYVQPKKTLRGKPVPKTIIINKASDEWHRFFQFSADIKKSYSVHHHHHHHHHEKADFQATNIQPNSKGVLFQVNNKTLELSLIGSFNVENALAAVVIADVLEASETALKQGLKNLGSVPGRMERIDCGQPFTVFVDYAHDSQSIEAVLRSIKEIIEQTNGRIIILLGAEGGGRDKKKRPQMGALAAKYASQVILSNVDPYEENPKIILEDIAQGAEATGAIRNENLHIIEDRRLGIRQALKLANKNDIVLITGKGAEQSIIINNKSSPWDDRKVVAEELCRLHN